jgi:hypothetical protein
VQWESCIKIVEQDTIDTLETQIHDCSLSWHEIGTQETMAGLS